MSVITEQDFVQSIADALQYISYYHSEDFIRALGEAYAREEAPAARDAMLQILTSSKMSAFGQRPICQDTGIVVAFVKIGMNVRWQTRSTIEEMVNAGVRLAYTHPDNPLRASIVADPAGKRINTRDNAPAVIHISTAPGEQVEFSIAAKGGGSENKARLAMLNPSDSVVDWVLATVPGMGAGWCPPGVLGIGIGGSAEKAMLLAKESLMEDLDMAQSRLSWHLKTLADAGIIRSRREGRWNYYTLDQDALTEAHDIIAGLRNGRRLTVKASACCA